MTPSPHSDKQLAEKFFRARLVVLLHDLYEGDARRRQWAQDELTRHGLTEKTARRRLSAKLPK